MTTLLRREHWLWWTVVSLLLTALWSAPLSAESTEAADVAKAQSHFEKGAEWYTRGDYSKAIVEFLKGNSISPNAMFLYNISLCYGKLNNLENAIQAGEKAIRLGLQPSVVPRNQARIGGFSSIIKAKRIADDVIEKKEAARAEAERAQSEALRLEKNARIGETNQRRDSGADSSFGALGWTGVAVGTVGLGLLGAALVIDQQVDDDLLRYQQAAEDADQQLYSELRSSIQNDQFLGKIFLTSGVATTVMGLIFIIANSASDETVSLHIAPRPSGVTFTIGGRFGSPN